MDHPLRATPPSNGDYPDEGLGVFHRFSVEKVAAIEAVTFVYMSVGKTE
jgi:hypothetical protein